MTPPVHTREELIDAAREAAQHAYAPYSGFAVGAALVCTDGTIVRGCNVENASFGLVVCAERAAVTAAVAHGQRTFTSIAIWVDGDEGQPCGACRQTLAEFAPHINVTYRSGGAWVTRPLAELLPDAFVPATLRERT